MSAITLAHIAEHFFGVSTESLPSGQLHDELELTMYAEMSNIGDLSKAVSKEIHEQYEVPLQTNTKIRQRIRGVNGKRWLQTVKIPRDDKPGNWESEDDISEATFKVLRAATPEEGYLKERYFFPIIGTDLVYEVDVYQNNGGTKSAWVKIDLEFKDTTMSVPPLPFATKSIIYADNPNTTQVERNWIKQLWEDEWQSVKLTT